MIALFVLFSVLSIFLYNYNVNLKYGISDKEKAIQIFESANADLRNELYQKTDIKNLGNFAEKYNLVQEKNPGYMEHRALANR